MIEQQRHEMILDITHPSGAEEWYCPTCGRRMEITWQPWKKTVIEPGDIYATHAGSKGMLKIGLQINRANEADLPSPTDLSIDDPYLSPWMKWLNSRDWDDLWNEET